MNARDEDIQAVIREETHRPSARRRDGVWRSDGLASAEMEDWAMREEDGRHRPGRRRA